MTDNPYQFVGSLGYYTHTQAPEFGLIQTGFRFYDPEVGRYTQQDPIGDGINWYAYCGGNPMAGVDPWGLEAILIPLPIESTPRIIPHPIAIIIGGAYAAYDLYHWYTTGETGIFTGLGERWGEQIGGWLYPDPPQISIDGKKNHTKRSAYNQKDQKKVLNGRFKVARDQKKGAEDRYGHGGDGRGTGKRRGPKIVFPPIEKKRNNDCP